MCSLYQTQNPYLVHIDHFLDLDEEFDELDGLVEVCAACGCEAADCDCVAHDSDDPDARGIEADTSLTPFTPFGLLVKGAAFPFAKAVEGLGKGVNSIAGNGDVQSAQERDANVAKNEDKRVARLVMDLNREGAGMKKFLSLGQKNKQDEMSVRGGGKGGNLSWIGFSWVFTKHDIDDFEHDFKIVNMKTEITTDSVKDDKLMLQLAHKMFSTSVWKRSLAVRKMTYREAMNDLYKKRKAFNSEQKKNLDRWWKRDHRSTVVSSDAKNKKAEHHEVRKHANGFKKKEFEQEITNRKEKIDKKNGVPSQPQYRSPPNANGGWTSYIPRFPHPHQATMLAHPHHRFQHQQPATIVAHPRHSFPHPHMYHRHVSNGMQV